MPIKVITDYKSLKYFITIKKLTKCQACWAEFLFYFKFVIFYIPERENQKIYLLTRCSNNLPLSENDDCQQHQLQTLFSAKRLEIGSITKKKNITIIKELVKANLKDDYCSKLRHSLKTGHPVKEIDLRYFSHLSINSKNYI